ncbi:MAG: hypothetical protein SFV15_22325 [Polyangiaceae bacterium]|nr:hypothetical protein [Polyangiaceae bacterium]
MTSETIFAAFRRIAKDLTAEQPSFAVVGGIAISVRAEVRFTRVTWMWR